MQRVQCLDIGNSSTKFGIFEDEKITEFKQFNTSDLLQKPELFSTTLSAENGNLIFCSVVPAVESSILNLLSRLSIKIHSISSNFCAEIPISYENKSEIGADRLANAIAAYCSLSLPAVIIDLGTATTFDIISEQGGYEGGIILPGQQGFLDFLSANTALLPAIELANHSLLDLPFGKSTMEAMLVGAFSGYQSMIEGMVEKLKDSLHEKFRDIPTFTICGGSALKLTLNDCNHFEHLTLHGLRLANEIYYKNLN